MGTYSKHVIIARVNIKQHRININSSIEGRPSTIKINKIKYGGFVTKVYYCRLVAYVYVDCVCV